MKLREYEFEVLPFANGDVERIGVVSPNRAFGFTLAASKATDPNNVRKVRLVSDNGRDLDPYDLEEWKVPPEYSSSGILYGSWDRASRRVYGAEFVLFGGGASGETVSVSGRVNVFTAIAIYSTTPDGIMEVCITFVGSKLGGYFNRLEVSQGKIYGGITVDLNDPVINDFRPRRRVGRC